MCVYIYIYVSLLKWMLAGGQAIPVRNLGTIACLVLGGTACRTVTAIVIVSMIIIMIIIMMIIVMMQVLLIMIIMMIVIMLCIGWHCLSNATRLIQLHLFYTFVSSCQGSP